MDGNRQHVDSNGNRVNVGNFDSDGLNVNNNWDDNRNDNIGLASARQSFSIRSMPVRQLTDGHTCSYSFADLIHPPSIRPISSMGDWSAMYFLLSIVFTSFSSRRSTRNRLSFTLTFSSAGIFSDLYCWLASRIPSMTSSRAFSQRGQTVSRSCLGIL